MSMEQDPGRAMVPDTDEGWPEQVDPGQLEEESLFDSEPETLRDMANVEHVEVKVGHSPQGGFTLWVNVGEAAERCVLRIQNIKHMHYDLQ